MKKPNRILAIVDVPKDRLFSRPFAQIGWALLECYCGKIDPPDWFTAQHIHQIENWLVNDARMEKE